MASEFNQSCFSAHKETILAECKEYIRCNETEKLQLMFKLMDRVPDQEGVNTMLSDLEEHIYASGIADMVESADVITQVRTLLFFGKDTFSVASLPL